MNIHHTNVWSSSVNLLGVKLVSDQLDYAPYVTYNDQENYARKVIIQFSDPYW